MNPGALGRGFLLLIVKTSARGVFAGVGFAFMKTYTTPELAAIYDKKDWATLWKIVTPMVKHAVRRCMQHGEIDPFYVREDIMQEAYLAAWECLPRWNAFEAGLQRWLEISVRRAVLDRARREAGGMVGGRDAETTVVSIHANTADEDGGDEEQDLAYGLEATLVAETEDPAGEWLLKAIPAEDRDMVRRLAGIGAPRQTAAEYAAAEGLSLRSVRYKLADLRKLFLHQNP